MNRQQLMEILIRLREISSECGGLYLDEIEQLHDLFQENKYKVAVMGEFSTGKSTFLNALVGKRILFSSMREATGVITCLQKGKKAEAVIAFEDGNKRYVSLEKEQGYKELEQYVDIKNTATKVSGITVFYPINGFDEDIAFIDTPGLQGISTKQAEMTRNIVKECNATIMLIKPNGLTAPELEILKGNNRIFGKINTKDIFLVVNQIGTVYEGKSKEEAEAAVKRIHNAVETVLQDNGLEGLKIFLVDSRDYLWSADQDEYKKEQAASNAAVHTLLSPEEYRGRSRFEGFRAYLMEFLEVSQRNKNFIEDMQMKAQMLVEGFKEFLQEENKTKNDEGDQHKEQLETQKEIILNNRRRLYNLLARYLSESFEAFEKNVLIDIEGAKHSKTKDLAKIIDESIEDQEDLQRTVAQECYKKVHGAVQQDATDIENKLNQYQKTLTTYLLQKQFNEDLAKTLHADERISLSFNMQQLKIILEDQPMQDFTDEEAVKIEERELLTLQKERQAKKLQFDALRKDTSSTVMAGLEKRRMHEGEKKQQALIRLGTKPEPRAVYKTIIRKKGFWIFKTEEAVDVFDYWDDSSVNDWEKKRRAVLLSYNENLDKIEDEKDEYREQEKMKGFLEKQLQELLDGITKQQQSIYDLKIQIDQKKLNNKKRYIKEQKNNVFKYLKKHLQNEYDDIARQVNSQLRNMAGNIKDKLKDQVYTYMEQYSEQLKIQIESIKKQTNLTRHKQSNILSNLLEVEGRLDEF